MNKAALSLVILLVLVGAASLFLLLDTDSSPTDLTAEKVEEEAPIPPPSSATDRPGSRKEISSSTPHLPPGTQPSYTLQVYVGGRDRGAIAGIKVLVSPKATTTGKEDPPPPVWVLTNKTGNALIGIPPGFAAWPLTASVDHPDFLPWSGALRPQQANLEVELLRPGKISGRVLDQRGKPTGGALISITHGPAFSGDRPPPRQTHSVTGTGAYSFTRVPAGKVVLKCFLRAATKTRALVSREKEDLARAGETIQVDFDFSPMGPLITGFLLDAASRPLEGWSIVANEKGSLRARTRVAKDGAFRLQIPNPTTVDLLVSQDDTPAPTWLHMGRYPVPAKGVCNLQLRLGGLEIYGRLGATPGDTLPGKMRVSAWREKGATFALAATMECTARNSGFILPGLPDGTYRLTVTATGYPDLLTFIGPLQGGRHDLGILEISREGAGELIITCQGKNNPPPRECAIWRQEDDTLIPLDLRPLAPNKYLARPLPAGKQKLRVEAPGYVPTEIPVEIKAGRTAALTLVFIKGYPFTLAVDTPAGKPLESLLGRTQKDGPDLNAQRRGDGLWTFAALPPGKYVLLIGAPGFHAQRLQVEVPATRIPAARVTLRPH